MHFTKINFVFKLDIQIITGFTIWPLKEIKNENKEKATIKCPAEEATAWGVMAQVPNDSVEWIADFKLKEDALNFATLVQAIYMCGVHHENTIKPEMFAIECEGENQIIGIIAKGANFDANLKAALAEHFEGEVTHLSEPEERRDYTKAYKVIIREDGGEDEIFDGEINIIPVPIY